MKQTYEAIRWEEDEWWVEVRLHNNGHVSANGKTHDGTMYENQGGLYDFKTNAINKPAINIMVGRVYGVGNSEKHCKLRAEMYQGVITLLSRRQLLETMSYAADCFTGHARSNKIGLGCAIALAQMKALTGKQLDARDLENLEYNPIKFKMEN